MVWRRGLQDGVDLLGAQIAQEGPRLSFVGNGQHSARQRQVLGFLLSDKPHEAMDRGQPGVAAACATVALLFQMIQEAQNVRGIPILQPLLRGASMGLSLAIAQQKPEGVAVTGHGAGA